MSITVLLLIALCLLCVVVFLKHKKTERFYEQSCPSIECPDGTSKHIVFSGTPQQKMGCCSNSINGIGQYFDGKECKDCQLGLGTENANYLTGKSRTSNYTTTKNSTVASCKAECKTGNWIEHIASTPGTGWFESPTSNAYPTSECDKSVAYSNVYLDPDTEAYSNLTIRYDTADSNAPNFENSWCSNNIYSKNNSNYCCTDSNIPRYNNAAPNDLGCCASNEYLSDAGSCSSCSNGGLCSNDLNQSGILCCSISNCKLSNSPPSTLNTERDAIWAVGNTYYSNNTAVTNINNYSCYAHYQYNKLSDIAANDSNIVSLSNTVYFDGSNYHYLDDDRTNSNNIINSNSISIDSDSNWFYHNDGNSNTLSSKIEIPVREYVDNSLTLKNYSRYYKCDTDKFLRCAQPYDDSATESTESTGCGCCSSNEYFDRTNCKSVDSNTEMIADNQLYLVDLDKCLSGWGKNNFDANNNPGTLCTKCGNLVYYDSLSNDNTCRPCPSGQYPNSMDDSDNLNISCSNAPVFSELNQNDWYRFKYSTGTTHYYLTYTSNTSNYTIFRKGNDSFTYNNSNMYHWSNDTNEVKIQLPETDYASGKFLKIDASTLTSDIYLNGTNFKPIRYCEAGSYANNNSCDSCPAGKWSSNYGIENESDCQPCPANSTSPEGSTSSDACECDSVSGYFQSAAGSCEQCLADYYLDNGTCQQCPGNTTSPAGSTSSDACECDPGKYYNGSSCVICPINKYCPGGSITGDGLNNHSCIDNSSSDQGSDQQTDCQCNPGFYDSSGNWLGGGPCQECPSNYYCEGGTTGFTSCLRVRPNTRSLPGSSNGDQCKCKEGHYLTTIYGSSRCVITENPYYSPNYDNEPYECPANTTIGSGGSSVDEC